MTQILRIWLMCFQFITVLTTEEKWNAERDRVTKIVDAQVEQIAKAIDSESAGFNKSSSGYIAISGQITQGMMLHPQVNPSEVRAVIESQFGADAVNGDKSDNDTIRSIRQSLSSMFISKADGSENSLWTTAWREWDLRVRGTS